MSVKTVLVLTMLRPYLNTMSDPTSAFKLAAEARREFPRQRLVLALAEMLELFARAASAAERAGRQAKGAFDKKAYMRRYMAGYMKDYRKGKRRRG